MTDEPFLAGVVLGLLSTELIVDIVIVVVKMEEVLDVVVEMETVVVG